jgi:hypothetical protein
VVYAIEAQVYGKHVVILLTFAEDTSLKPQVRSQHFCLKFQRLVSWLVNKFKVDNWSDY